MTTSSLLTSLASGRPSGHPELDGTLLTALGASRTHWKAVADLAFDLSFETDREGRLVALSSAGFGWSMTQLLGRDGRSLLETADPDGVDPFRPNAPCRRCRAWLRRGDGSIATVLVSSAPKLAPDGSVDGAVGGIQDITEQDALLQEAGDQLQTYRHVARIARRMRRALLPDMIIRIGLEELLEALGGYGAAIIASDPLPEGVPLPGNDAKAADDQVKPPPRVLHRAGEMLPATDQDLVALTRVVTHPASATPWSRVQAGLGRILLLSAIATHFCEPVILMLWREAGRGWTEADMALVDGFMANLGGVLEHDQVQRALARQSGADALTGLLTRESFGIEVNRRLERLDAEGLSATLMVIGLDRFEALNQSAGYERGDRLLRSAAQLLRDAVRPTDLAARLGGDVFALWLDGADQFAAAERAENLCKSGVDLDPGGGPDLRGAASDRTIHLRLSIGLTTRPTRSFESIETLLEQAHAALGAIKLAGGGRWHFYNEGISQ